MKRRAWAPAHISTVFYPVVGQTIGNTGSIGAGFCLEKGAIAEIAVEFGQGKTVFSINGEKEHLDVTESAVSFLEKKAERPIRGRINIETPYPNSQGFGMSAAGTLATTIALSDILSLHEEDAWLAAHGAEISRRTGLGDVAAEITGGAVLRKKAGIPSTGGEAVQFDLLNNGEEVAVIVAIIGEKLRTDSVLADITAMDRIRRWGDKALQKLTNIAEEHKEYIQISASDFAKISREFALNSGLATQKIVEAFDILEDSGLDEKYPFSMVMLGNTIFFLPQKREREKALKEVKRRFSPHYPVATYYLDSISKKGASLLD